jgi:TonB family protein
MTLPVAEKSRLRSSVSFAASACVHSWVLAWVILGGVAAPSEHAKSIYDQEIRPNEKKIVWYSLRDKLPEISPPEAAADARPPRAHEKSPQTMVSGKTDDPNPGQLIWTPAPEVATPKPAPLPNVIAVAPPPKVVRPFIAPPVIEPPPPAAPVLPEAPRVAAAAAPNLPPPVPGAGAKPQPRAFTPPPDVRMQRQAAILLPEAPTARETVVEPNALPWAGAGPRPQPRAFTPPPSATTRAAGPVALPAIPDVAGAAAPTASLGKVPRAFVPPPSRPAPAGQTPPGISADAPTLPGTSNLSSEASLAIVGLNPAKGMDVPAPPTSRAASFSAGPETRLEGGAGGSSITLLNVPGLIVKGGPKDSQPTLVSPPFSATSKENLLAAARIARNLPPKPPEEPNAPRMSEAPDPRLAGRVIYTVAIQMPNVTSYSGSWLVWFAEHEPVPGSVPPQMKPPVPLRKVDPKYIAAAAADRVEGKVRLFGVIRKDGHVDGIALLLHLDARLDSSAQEALTKWEFEPALRNGRPVDVDAVFEIPFHLAPRPAK